MRKLPIGIQTFEEIRRDGYLYVDKTAMVYQIANVGKPYFLAVPVVLARVCFFLPLKPTFKDARICFKVWPSNSWKRNGKNIRFCTWI